MIAKRIDREPENDNFRNLASYLQNAHHHVGHGRLVEYIEDRQKAYGEEKVLYKWFAGCIADTYDLAIKEVEVTQELNTRVTTGKTYHLMLSFRPEDEARLTEEVFQEIELEFARALGFEEHQRHCGVHKNTDNLHIHIAYNMIHPEKLTKHEPFQDFNTLSQTCRAMEQKYGLVVDRGMEEAQTKERIPQRAKAMEAHTGQESFITYSQRHHDEWRDAAEQAQSWAEFHNALAAYDVEYTLRGNGAVLMAKNTKAHTACKASLVARELSKAALCKKFGEFTPALEQSAGKDDRAYSRQPLSADALARQQYKEASKERREALVAIQKKKEESLKKLRQSGEVAREEAKGAPISRRERGRLGASFSMTEKRKREEINQNAEKAAALIKDKIPFANWSQFVQHYEQQGNEPLSPAESPLWKEFQEGLSQRMEYFELIYERRKKDLERVNKLAEKARQEAATVPLTSRDRSRLSASFRETEQLKRQEIINNANEAKERMTEKVPFSNWNQFLQWKAEQGDAEALLILRKKNIQQEVSTLRTSEEQESELPSLFADAKVKITKQGTVVIGLKCGELRDTGDTLFFRGDDTVAQAAELYAHHKWGKETSLESGANYIRNVPKVVRQLEAMEAKAMQEHERPAGLGL